MVKQFVCIVCGKVKPVHLSRKSSRHSGFVLNKFPLAFTSLPFDCEEICLENPFNRNDQLLLIGINSSESLSVEIIIYSFWHSMAFLLSILTVCSIGVCARSFVLKDHSSLIVSLI